MDSPLRSRCLTPLLALALICAELEANPSWELQTGWETQYISEGRRALEASGGIVTAMAVATDEVWFAEFWNAFNSTERFWELDASLGMVGEFGRFSSSLGYTFVRVSAANAPTETDHECFLGVGCVLTETTELAFDLVYGRAASAGYAELGLVQAIPMPGDLEWTVRAAMAWDFGYASAAFDGLSHCEVATEWTFPWETDWALGAFARLIVPFEDVDREGGATVASGGVSLMRTF